MNATAKNVPTPHLQRLKLLQPFKWRLLAGLVFMALAVVIQLAYPKAVAFFIDSIHIQRSSDWYGKLALLMLVVIIVQAVATTLRYYLFESTGYLVVTKIRRQLYAALINKSIGYYDGQSVGELNNRLTADVEILHETLTMGLAIALRCVCVVVGGVVMLLTISPPLSLMLVFFIPASLLLGKGVGKRIHRQASEIQGAQAACGKVAHEHFTNIRLVHAFNQQKTALKKYFSATENALSISVASTWLRAVLRGALSVLVYLALLMTLWLGARLISQGEITIGELTGFILYASMVTDSASALSEFWGEWMRAIGATEKIFEIIGHRQEGDGHASSSHAISACQKPQLQGNITFDKVIFSYPERLEKTALNSVSFKILSGEKVALVGASGAGKSTIASLVLGFYLPDQGEVVFDDKHSTCGDMIEIRKHIAIVEQEPSLFSGTVFENIAFAVSERNVSLDEVMEVAKLAFAHDFIQNFPGGYNAVVGDRGVQLSGGQKQRIAIARALLRNPKILILDEATSALDSASEGQVQQALDQLMVGRTTVIIAHRCSTIVKADRVLVLAHGSISQQGTHEELIKQQDGLYFALMGSQLS